MSSRADIILPMSRTSTEDYMQLIVTREKDHEFRTRRFLSSVGRIWFYETAPISAVTYICEIGPARTRAPDDIPLPRGGKGNVEFNSFHPDWKGYDYAYKIKSCRQLEKPITLAMLKGRYGFGGAPRGMVYVTTRMEEDFPVMDQQLLWSDEDRGGDH